MTTPPAAVPQGFGADTQDRLPLMPREAMSPAQREAADALIAGPRKAVFGPFVPLLRSPELMSRVGKLGEYLRFESALPERIRELVTCFTARHVSNQFEWLMHAPLAKKAGVPAATLDAIAAGRQPRGLPDDDAAALDFAGELLRQNGVSDASYAAALAAFDEQGIVELATLVGYFAMVSWVMNVARTPGPVAADHPPLGAFPG